MHGQIPPVPKLPRVVYDLAPAPAFRAAAAILEWLHMDIEPAIVVAEADGNDSKNPLESEQPNDKLPGTEQGDPSLGKLREQFPEQIAFLISWEDPLRSSAKPIIHVWEIRTDP
jgi:hypothetical protein